MCGLFDSWVGQRLWSFLGFLVHIVTLLYKGFTKLHWELLKFRGNFHLALTTITYETAMVSYHINSSTLSEISSWGRCHLANKEALAWVHSDVTLTRGHLWRNPLFSSLHCPLHRLEPHWVPCWGWESGLWSLCCLGHVTFWRPMANATHSSPIRGLSVHVFVKNSVNEQITMPSIPPEGRVVGIRGGLGINCWAP